MRGGERAEGGERRAVLPARLERRLVRAWRRGLRARDRQLLAAIRSRAGQPVLTASATGAAAAIDLGDGLALRLAPVHSAAAAAVEAAAAAGPLRLLGATRAGGLWALHLGDGRPVLALLAGGVAADPGGGTSRRRSLVPAVAA